MALRNTIQSWRNRLAPFFSLAAVLALAVVLIMFAPARTAAMLLGIAAGAWVARALTAQARYGVQTAVLWICVAVTADAAYARLNDQAPITLANGVIRILDTCVKLAEPLIRGTGLTTGDPRAKVAAVAPEFVWALILTLVAMLATGFPNMGRSAR
jgi:hypothetical protein